ncbi:MAG: DEAD/DEAH box helicase family protein [Chlorobium sp.]|nr:DEAD/DEAH box helicase family protein [Chlorobium sp.]
MDKHAIYIKNRLSLRSPQVESLKTLADIADTLTLKKECDLAKESERIRSFTADIAAHTGTASVFSDFEREFPCCCFALATGVGKTRLMGAFITWLNQAKGIKNFFVLAPNLTVYNKLIEDFSNPRNPKYVFPGIGEFVHRPPGIITGENYNSRGNLSLFDESITINIFNISKINASTTGDDKPRIKRLSEYLGQSYFDHLAGLNDLVVLMDESHHYRALEAVRVINELNPILGIELTATPKVQIGQATTPFKNVVYQYGLGKAMEDGFVKEPAVATRRNFDPNSYQADELDTIKLEDGIRIHEDTKVALEIYARDEECRLVKPFVLVVTRDTDHAAQVREHIQSTAFFEGRYSDKVIVIHSNLRGDEKDDNIKQLLTLEDADNKIEIVIHVNMLKEGWDVTNLYTIIPLRTAASVILTEQTIGRGLRLPYGKRTGNSKVDKLTIIAHDNFQNIINEANKPDSIINQKNIIEIDPEAFEGRKEVVVAKTAVEERMEAEKKHIEAMPESQEKVNAGVAHEIKKAIHNIIPQVNSQVKNVSDLNNQDIKDIIVTKVKERLQSSAQPDLYEADIIAKIEEVYQATVDEFILHVIEIPRISILQSDEVESGYKDFDLSVTNLSFQSVAEEILIQYLNRKENSQQVLIGKFGDNADKPENLILNELINYSDIDYDSQSELLQKLVGQALLKLRSNLNNEENLLNVVKYHKRDIAAFIYSQMKPQFYCNAASYEEPVVLPFTKIESHNLTKIHSDDLHDYNETITPVSAIPQKVFSGFQKACHSLYKFDSKAEKDFAVNIEHDSDVCKWLRPAPKQFKIYWDHNARMYEPDFVVETQNTIYLTEIKALNEMADPEVLQKAKAAKLYCEHASNHNALHGGKAWKYLLIPHNEILPQYGFTYLAGRREFVEP